MREGMQGATFGIMDAIITVLGVMIGLSVTQNKLILLAGVITAGVADSFANAAGFHVSEETESIHTRKEVLKSTVYCFLATLVTTIVLSIPILLLKLKYAVITSTSLGLIFLILLGCFVSKSNKKFCAWKFALEYLAIGIIVTTICYGLGRTIFLG